LPKELARTARPAQIILLLPLVLALGISALMLTALAGDTKARRDRRIGLSFPPEFALCEEGAAQSPIDIAAEGGDTIADSAAGSFSVMHAAMLENSHVLGCNLEG